VVLRLSLIAGLWLFGRFVIAYTQHAASAVLVAPQPDPPQLTTLAFWGGLSCSAVPGRHHSTLTLGLSLSLSLSLRLSPSLSLRLRLSLRLSLSLSLGLRLSPMMLTRHFGWSSKTMMVTNTMDVRQHGQNAPFGRTRARPLRLRRAHLATLCGAALPGA
jgi:hypothetical protein